MNPLAQRFLGFVPISQFVFAVCDVGVAEVVDAAE